MVRKILILGFACGLAPAIAIAQADPFRAIDRNRDGSVTAEEWYAQSPAPVPFTVVDLDNDGKISQAEFQDWSAARGSAREGGITSSDRFRMADRNKDSAISEQEWKDRFPFANFQDVDHDKDQRITYQEFAAWDTMRGGAGGAVATAAPPGAGADLMADRMRTLDANMRGAAGVSGAAGLPGPAGAVPSNNAPASVGTPGTMTIPRVTPETSSVTGTVNTSPGASPGASTPALGTGSSLLSR